MSKTIVTYVDVITYNIWDSWSICGQIVYNLLSQGVVDH